MACERVEVKDMYGVTVRDVATGNTVNGTDATVGFTSQFIPMPIGKEWSLNVHFNSLTKAGKQPTVTIYGTNTEEATSINEINKAVDVEVPRLIYKKSFPAEYMVIVYDPQGATGGLKRFDLRIEK